MGGMADDASGLYGSFVREKNPGECPQVPVDAINPAYYKGASGVEVIDFIEAFRLQYDHYLASAIAYILRAGKKPGTPEGEDIRKAIWYLERRLRGG